MSTEPENIGATQPEYDGAINKAMDDLSRPERVPLGPEDVPPGTVFRYPAVDLQHEWQVAISISGLGIWLFRDGVEFFPFTQLETEEWQITRDGGRTWQPCWKTDEPPSTNPSCPNCGGGTVIDGNLVLCHACEQLWPKSYLGLESDTAPDDQSSREAFEAWFQQTYPSCLFDRDPTTQNYTRLTAMEQWITWQAAVAWMGGAK